MAGRALGVQGSEWRTPYGWGAKAIEVTSAGRQPSAMFYVENGSLK